MLTGLTGAIYMLTGAGTSMTKTATTANADYTKYTISTVARRYLDKSRAITVYVDDVLVSSDQYIVELGTIIFDVALTAPKVVTVSAYYFATAQVGGFFNFKVSMSRKMVDATTFGDTWKQSLPTTLNWTATADRFWLDETISGMLGSELILVFFLNTTSRARYEGYGFMSKNGIDMAFDALIKENCEFTGNTELFYRAD